MAFLDLRTLKDKLESLRSSDIRDFDKTLTDKEYQCLYVNASDGSQFKIEVDNQGNLFTTRITK